MRRSGMYSLALAAGCFAVCLTSSSAAAQKKEWATIKGQIVWQGDVPKQAPIKVTVPANICKDAPPIEEDYMVNPKNKGVKNVFVWIRPTGAKKDAAFPAAGIHPNLMMLANKNVEIDQPCCKFIPHVLAAREGQTMTIKNSASFAHNAKWSSENNGDINPLMVAGAKFVLPKALVAEPGEISLSCSIHGWMKAHVRVFDHPYFAVTDDDGNFEIKLAPTGKYSVFVHHPANGWLNGKDGRNGMARTITPGVVDLGPLKMKANN
jgi:plastocyanin